MDEVADTPAMGAIPFAYADDKQNALDIANKELVRRGFTFSVVDIHFDDTTGFNWCCKAFK